MADRKGLAIIGLILGGVTLATVTVAGAIVQWHLDGRVSFDERGALVKRWHRANRCGRSRRSPRA
jgi:hypothetical protein